MVAEEGRGVVLYVQGHEGRGIGLVNKIKAYRLQTEERLDTYAANAALGLPIDERSYETSRAIFAHLGVRSLRLITNNPLKVEALGGFVVETVPLLSPANEHNAGYLKAKREMEKQMGTRSDGHKQLKRSIKSILDEHPQHCTAASPPQVPQQTHEVLAFGAATPSSSVVLPHPSAMHHYCC